MKSRVMVWDELYKRAMQAHLIQADSHPAPGRWTHILPQMALQSCLSASLSGETTHGLIT